MSESNTFLASQIAMQMAHTHPATPEQTSRTVTSMRAFARGFFSNMVTGALMMGTLTVVALVPWFAALMPTPLGAAAIVLATGLFGGVMSVKRALFDQPEQEGTAYVSVPVQGPAMSQAIAPTVTPDLAPEHAPTKNWVASTGHGPDTQNRIEQILANGSMSDKDRATAILAAREAERANAAQQSRA